MHGPDAAAGAGSLAYRSRTEVGSSMLTRQRSQRASRCVINPPSDMQRCRPEMIPLRTTRPALRTPRLREWQCPSRIIANSAGSEPSITCSSASPPQCVRVGMAHSPTYQQHVVPRFASSVVASMRSRKVRPVVDADSQSTYQSSTMIDHSRRAKVQADVERART